MFKNPELQYDTLSTTKKKMTFGGKETHNTEQSKEVLNKGVSARQRKSLTDAFNKI